MSPERYLNLKGHSLLIVGSEKTNAILAANCYKAKVRMIDSSEDCPNNLLEYMNQNNIDLAIIHPRSLFDDETIIEAHRSGKKIVVIEGIWCTTDQREMYMRLRNAGLKIVEKDDDTYKKLEIYNELLGTPK